MSSVSAETGSHGSGHDHAPHAVPLWILVAVWAVLMILTFATVAVTRVDLGWLNIWIALLIALVKAGLVALYFMHLRWDSPFNAVVLIAALLFVVLFISLALIDTH